MLDEKVTRILLSKTNMTREEIGKLSSGEAWQLVYANQEKKPKDNRVRICFTGFSQGHRERLEEIAERHNMKIVASVSKTLNFLCAGEEPGPTKLEKASLFNVPVINEMQFSTFIEHGEIP